MVHILTTATEVPKIPKPNNAVLMPLIDSAAAWDETVLLAQEEGRFTLPSIASPPAWRKPQVSWRLTAFEAHAIKEVCLDTRNMFLV